MSKAIATTVVSGPEKNLHRVLLAEVVLSPVGAFTAVAFLPTGLGAVEAAVAGVLAINMAIWCAVLGIGIADILYRAAVNPHAATAADFNAISNTQEITASHVEAAHNSALEDTAIIGEIDETEKSETRERQLVG